MQDVYTYLSNIFKIERKKSGGRGARLNINMCGRHVWLWKACLVRGYIRVGERASLVEVEPAFRSETRTRRVIDKQIIHGRAQVAG